MNQWIAINDNKWIAINHWSSLHLSSNGFNHSWWELVDSPIPKGLQAPPLAALVGVEGPAARAAHGLPQWGVKRNLGKQWEGVMMSHDVDDVSVSFHVFSVGFNYFQLMLMFWVLDKQRKPVLLGCFLYIVFYRKQQVQVGLKIWGSCKWPQRLENQPRSWKSARLVVETITQVPATVSQCTGLYVHSESDCNPFEVGYIRVFTEQEMLQGCVGPKKWANVWPL